MLDEEYGKYPEINDIVIMEYKYFTSLLVNHLPASLSSNNDFKLYLSGSLPATKLSGPYDDMMWSYADMFVMTL